MLTHALNSVIFLVLLVSRSKLVPDFAITIHIIHLIVTSLYSGALPSNWLWWALQFASAALMTSLGVWSCRWRELKPISFGGNVGASSSDQQSSSGNGTVTGGGSGGSWFGRGRGQSNGRDGGGEYEMVGMKEGSEDAV